MDTATTLAPLQPEQQQAAPRHDGPIDPIDPRIRRTRELLQQSLGQLLETKDFDRISVHEITDAAGVNRATFYAHYTDKFALLECMVATRFHALLDERGIVVQGGCTNALRGLVVGLCDFLANATCPSAEQTRPLQPHMETALVAVLRRMLLDGMASHDAALATNEAALTTQREDLKGMGFSPVVDNDDLKGTGFSPSVHAGVGNGALAPEGIGPVDNLRAAAIAGAIYSATREALNTPHHPPADQLATVVVALVAPLFAPAGL